MTYNNYLLLLTALSMLYHLFRAAVTGRVLSLDLTNFTTYLHNKIKTTKNDLDNSYVPNSL